MFANWQQDNRIPLALMALMGLFLIVYLYDLVTDFNIEQPLPMPASSHIEPIAQIGQLHVFGIYNDDLQNLPETQLQLTLQGVMLSVQDQTQSYAIISSPSVPAKAYKVGSTIPGDATLKKVMKDEIVISYQGVLQSLKLPVDQLTFDNAN
jgi:general secretion pathway protein C